MILGKILKQDEPYVIAAPIAGADTDYQFVDTFLDRSFYGKANIEPIMKLQNVYFTLTTDANVANRTITVEIEDADGNVIYSCAHATVITASLVTTATMQYGYYKDWDAGSLLVVLPLPDIYIRDDYSFTVTITNIQVTDQISAVTMRYDLYEGLPHEGGQP